ncbi:hypothetical protein GF352_03030 [archaeon]|nr:hypothetical protein [archaeon]
MSGFSFFLLLGVALLFLSVFFVNLGTPVSCLNDTRLCPDGSTVGRDRLNNCEFYECPNTEFVPYCSTGVISVERSGDFVKTVNSGFTVYEDNVTHCPDTSPGNMTTRCRTFIFMEWEPLINCSKVVSNLTFSCPQEYFEQGDYKWINCEFEEFSDYCEPRYKQWISYNCPGIDII